MPTHPRAASSSGRCLRIAMLLLAAALAGCQSNPGAPGSETSETRAAQPVDAHNSRDSLDWAGTYAGVLPCADCPGIETRLVLHGDGRFELSTRYLDRQVAAQTGGGRFTWNSAGSTITLDAAGRGQQFRVGEGRLLQLDRDGTSPSWDAPHRVLTRVTTP